MKAPDTHGPETRFERFLIRYPSGTVIESYYLIGNGGTLREVQVEHALAVVEAAEDSRVSGEVDRT